VNLKPDLKKKEQKARVQYFQDRSAFSLAEKVLSLDLTPMTGRLMGDPMTADTQ